MSEPRATEVLQRVAAYLREHPDACDTACSMARWWFDPEEPVSLRELRHALAVLVRSGVVEASVAGDGHRRYYRVGSDQALDEAVRSSPVDAWSVRAGDDDASQSLADSLRQLDAVLAAAIGELDSALGREAADAPFRGLCVSRADAANLLALAPGGSFWSVPRGSGAASRFSAPGGASRLEALRRRFALDAFETDALLLAASPDLDQRYERLYGLLQDDVTRRRPTLATVVHLAAAEPLAQWQGLARFAGDGALLRSRLARIVADPAQPVSTLGARYLVADEQVVRFLAGHDDLEPGLQAYCALEAAAHGAEFDATLQRHPSLTARMRGSPAGPPAWRFFGATAWERRQLAGAMASQRGAGLLRIDLDRVDGTGADVRGELERALLVARLRGAVALVESAGRQDTTWVEVLALARRMGAGPQDLFIVSQPRGDGPLTASCIEVLLPDAQERRSHWRAAFEGGGRPPHQGDLDEVAVGFQLDGAQIRAAARAALQSAAAGTSEAMPRDALFAAARAQLALRLPRAVVAIEPRAGWADLVLSQDTGQQLREVCAHVRGRQRVLGEWGFGAHSARGRGVNVLFSGASGTGKTTACEVLAGELGRSLLKIDLAQAVDKYVGESEKQLAEVFEIAEHSGAVLLFDEADALFGKRTAVSDAHDRYANIEVSYLLQRIEEYQGILVLTTNLQSNIDTAFARRLQFVVEFPFPDAAQRERIWRISVPGRAPVDADLDFAALAQRYPVTGGSIRNIALAGAMLAASEARPIAMCHMQRGARREYQKMGKSSPDADFFARGGPR